MPVFGDEVGLLWEDQVRSKARATRALPPIPDTGWTPPDEFPDLAGHGRIAIDCETYDPQLREKGPGAHRDGYIAGVAVGTDAGFVGYYPIAHKDGPNFHAKHVLGWLDHELRREGQPKVGANLLYDLDYLTQAGVRVSGPFYDVQVAEPLLNENRLSYDLDSIAATYLGQGKGEVQDQMTEWLERAFGKGNVKGNIWRAPPAVVGPYAEGDVTLPLAIFARQVPLLEAEGMWELFERVESRLIWPLLRMRQRGVRVDVEGAEREAQNMGQQRDEAIREIKRQTAVAPNLWEPESLARVFDAVNLDYPRTEKKGAPSFRKDWLKQQTHPIAQLINDARQADKLQNTFINGYILEGHVNGRIHGSFHQLRGDEGGTVTGRFSSSHPNLQNLPPNIRHLFLPEEGQRWWKFDWSQIEYRLIVHYAALIGATGADKAVNLYAGDSDVDFHQALADMTGLTRKDAKNLNFGLAYGQGVKLLCSNLGVDMNEGKGIINEYHRRAPFVRELMDAVTRRADRRGEVRTLLGRKRRFELWEKNGDILTNPVPGARRAFTHKSLNSLIQGSAADIMKQAMVDYFDSGALDVLGPPHLTVHDELDGSFPDTAEAREALQHVRHIMENCVGLRVPLKADQETGDNWRDVG